MFLYSLALMWNLAMMEARMGMEGEVVQLLVGLVLVTVVSHQFQSHHVTCHSQLSQRYSHHWPALVFNSEQV